MPITVTINNTLTTGTTISPAIPAAGERPGCRAIVATTRSVQTREIERKPALRISSEKNRNNYHPTQLPRSEPLCGTAVRW